MSDQEEEFDLDLLCDVAELEGYKERKNEEVRIMNKAMDIRLERIEKQKPKPKPVTVVDTDREENSRLLLRAGSRVIAEDEFKRAVGGRLYCGLDSLQTQGGIYTVGVVVERSGVLQSKNGKRFMTFKVSDLEKFDLQKVRKSIAN